MGTWKRTRGRGRLPEPPPNPYGAHPGAGWAPPRAVPGGGPRAPRIPLRKRLTQGQLILAAVVAAVLLLAYVILPLAAALS